MSKFVVLWVYGDKMNLISEYQPLVKSNARKLAYYYGVDRADLEQEGNFMLHHLQLLWKDFEIISPAYIQLRVIGAMKIYIADNLGPVAVPNVAFWRHGERAHGEGVGESTTSTDPETLYLKEEAEELFREQVIAFVERLTPEERIVFYSRILTDKPETTRNLAEMMEVKSPQTIINIAEKI
ncbi:unnamed protein product, partial [marine sediment metagenome]